jgi:A/G-specific adenine glycosylase
VADASRDPSDSVLVTTLLRWFDRNERPLPWRSTTPWGVLVSEFMLQQTPVDRVLPVWQAWLDRWPTPADLAAAPSGEAVRAWGRLGYPRRALRLHQAAQAITAQHGGQVPSDPDALRALPGVGEYTAAAVQAFAFSRRAVVLDTNVRRVVARAVHGQAQPRTHLTAAERTRAEELWPRAHRRSARWSAAVMEFGALVCTARAPACGGCPVRGSCRWLLAGQPPAAEPARRQAEYVGSDRQARGRIMAVLRERPEPVPASAIVAAWPDDAQRERALAALIGEGLVVRTALGRYALPS